VTRIPFTCVLFQSSKTLMLRIMCDSANPDNYQMCHRANIAGMFQLKALCFISFCPHYRRSRKIFELCSPAKLVEQLTQLSFVWWYVRWTEHNSLSQSNLVPTLTTCSFVWISSKSSWRWYINKIIVFIDFFWTISNVLCIFKTMFRRLGSASVLRERLIQLGQIDRTSFFLNFVGWD
jgi:hypothetical protein